VYEAETHKGEGGGGVRLPPRGGRGLVVRMCIFRRKLKEIDSYPRQGGRRRGRFLPSAQGQSPAVLKKEQGKKGKKCLGFRAERKKGGGGKRETNRSQSGVAEVCVE